jgi:ribosome maturation factor RimP
MITVIVDSDTHLNLDQVTVVTKEISEVIENLTALGEIPFTLEVTSPGVDRPLTLPRHWAKNLGRLVKASLNDGGEVKGRIGQSTQVSVVIDEATISYADIKKAVLEVEFK